MHLEPVSYDSCSGIHRHQRFLQHLPLKRLRQLVVDQLCAATGGPCVYIGRDMMSAHAGLGITEAEWNISVAHLVAALDKFHVPQAEKDEFLAIAASLKGDIVEKR